MSLRYVFARFWRILRMIVKVNENLVVFISGLVRVISTLMRTSILALLFSLSPAWAVNVYGTIRWNDVCSGSNALRSKCALDRVMRHL